MRCNILYYLNDDIKRASAIILIITGDTLQEASQKTGLTIGQIKRISTKENLQHKKKAFKVEISKEDWKRFKTVQRKISKLADIILSFTGRENSITKGLINNILSNIDISQLIF